MSEPYISKTEGDFELTLKVGEYFVLGDDVENSLVDSRRFGAVKESGIKGEIIHKAEGAELLFIQSILK